jgi:hypothetical protein
VSEHQHEITQTPDGTMVTVSCTCGWREVFQRHQRGRPDRPLHRIREVAIRRHLGTGPVLIVPKKHDNGYRRDIAVITDLEVGIAALEVARDQLRIAAKISPIKAIRVNANSLDLCVDFLRRSIKFRANVNGRNHEKRRKAKAVPSPANAGGVIDHDRGGGNGAYESRESAFD